MANYKVEDIRNIVFCGHGSSGKTTLVDRMLTATGMVNRLVARPDLESATMALAEQIAKAPPFALRLTKRSLNRGFDMQGFRTALQAHFDTHQLTHNSDEAQHIRNRGLGNAIAGGKNTG